MAEQRRPLKWSEAQCRVLALVFEGRLTRAKIADQCGISVRTCEDWIAHPEFQERIKAMREDVLASCDELQIAYARKEQRIMALSQIAESARIEYEQRVWREDRRVSPNGNVITNELYNREAFDAYRGALDDIAKELGHRKTIAEVTGKDGGAIEIADVTERIQRRLSGIRDAARAIALSEQSNPE